MFCTMWSLYANFTIEVFPDESDAASILQMWHRAVTNQSPHQLQILVTDNGELVSNAMANWCAQHGIDHHRTTPYTSAQNGWAECLHRTLLEKARAMLMSCKAPPEFWDEFCATSAYLTNLTATTTLQNRTPFELWFGRKPSLSHLQEIGCCAFALIPMPVPKSFAQSCSCILIGYSPHSKAYHLWDPTSRRIFNLFHVSFLEHLDDIPSDLLPGTTIKLVPDSPPSWDTASKPRNLPLPPPVPIQTTPTPSHIPTYFPIPTVPFVPSIQRNSVPSAPPVDRNTIPSIELNNVHSNQNNNVSLNQNNNVSSNQNNTILQNQINTVPSETPQNNTVLQNQNNNTVPSKTQQNTDNPSIHDTIPTIPPTVPSSFIPPSITPLHSVATGYVLGLQMPESGRPSQSDQRHRTAALLSPLLSRACSQDGPFLLVLRTISIDCK